MNHPDHARDTGAANLRFARALVDELRVAGIAAAVVCPGSRSTPLALAIDGAAGLSYTVHVDERSAAFYALGHAKASGQPVALVCTSGTAGANFLPAVAEAFHARIPLVVLTADRPPELRAWAAAQTMEQRSLYAGFTRWSEEAPCPSEGGGGVAYARALARRAVCEATGPAPGPVHLNLPFREPLVPTIVEADARPTHTVVDAAPSLLRETWEATGGLARELGDRPKGVLIFGPDAWEAGLGQDVRLLAESLGWPVLADPASGLRAGTTLEGSLIHGADLLLRDPATAAALQPDLIVRFGSPPTSKSIAMWMTQHASAEVWLVDPAAGFRDPLHRARRMLRANPRQFCSAARLAAGAVSTETRAWRARWQHAGHVVQAALADLLGAETRFLTPQLAQAIWASLPEAATLYVANSMAIRELDAFAGPRRGDLRVLANRGVNGIDGQISAALGAAAALGRPTVLWCGDLAFLHDVSGLLCGRLQNADLTVVVSNDDGGGIFEYLPVTRSVPREVFERLFAVPHGLDVCSIARGLGWEAARVESSRAFTGALSRALGGGRHVIEIPVDRAANTAFHGTVHDAVSQRLCREPAA
jgi:2-succinyl-5-enolpyruvyl-6-hydroxy-3-cyclohexene-1-carboxylate synthase